MSTLLSREPGATIAPELHATGFGRGEGLAGPVADHAGLKLGYGRHLLQHEAAGWSFDLRQIAEANVDPGLEELRQERQRARQP